MSNKCIFSRLPVANAWSRNKGRYTIDKNGYISLNLENAAVQDAIATQIHNLSGIVENKDSKEG